MELEEKILGFFLLFLEFVSPFCKGHQEHEHMEKGGRWQISINYIQFTSYIMVSWGFFEYLI